MDFDPWLVLRASAAPGSIQTGGEQSTITAHLRTHSNGATPSGNVFPDPTTIAFASDRGSIQPSADTTDASASAVPAVPLTLELVRARTLRVNRRGDFIVTTNTTGRGVLVGKGASRAGKAGRVKGQRKTSPGGRVRLRLRLGKAARERLASGGRVTAQITVTLTPIGGGTPITQTMNVRLVRG